MDLDSLDLVETIQKFDIPSLAFLDWQSRWIKTARPNQIPPDSEWDEMGYMAGRGFGKTRVGAEWLGQTSWSDPEALPRCVVAPTQNDVRFTCFEGNSGLLSVIPPECVLTYSSGDLMLTLTNGAMIRGFSAEKAERLRGPEHADGWCFVAGTQVSTPTGPQPIEALKSGDLVLTRRGPRKVTRTRNRLALVGEVGFSDTKLVGTTDHPVYTSHGWTDLGRLLVGDQVCAESASSGAGELGTFMVPDTTSGRIRAFARSVLSTCTGKSGLRLMGRSRWGTTYTTEMVTDATTHSIILSACRTARTAGITSSRTLTQLRDCVVRATKRTLATPVVDFSSGRLWCLRPTVLAASRGGLRTAARNPYDTAYIAKPPSDQGPDVCAASVASTWQPKGLQRVYCLTVEDAPEYFANGILVHNCDEIAAWGKDAEYTLDMLQMGLRIGPHPRMLWTSTPRANAITRLLTAPKRGRIIVRGATFDNEANLSKTFINKLAVYEGTKIGRQEIYGELLDPEEAGIVRRSQFTLWPKDKPLPQFEMILMSLDTAFTEKTVDSKGDPDPTACSVWGLFYIKRKAHVLLLDCWDDHLGLPDLIRRVKREMDCAYGDDEDAAIIRPLVGSSKPRTSGRKPDMLLIEDKGSGISLRQSLYEHSIEAYAYNPGRADKLVRLHIVSPIFAQRRVWVPESGKNPGKPISWAEPLISQLCAFAGEGSIKHDDYVDSTTQAFRLLMDKGLLSLVKQPIVEEVDDPPSARENPYDA